MDLIILNSTAKSITARIEAAHTTTAPSFVSAYADATASAFTEGGNNGVLNGTTEVEIVAAPAASTNRIVSEITVYNNDTVAHTLYISLLVTATYTIIRKVAIGVGGTYSFSADAFTFDMASAIQQATAKTTPVNADRWGFWDSVSGLLNYVTWENIKATLASTFAALAGSASQAFATAALTVSGNLTIGNNEIIGTAVSVTDDTAISFTPGTAVGTVSVSDLTNAVESGSFIFKTSVPICTQRFGTSNMARTTGPLAGTTGTDAKLTVSCHTDGKIYIENRLGSTRTIAYLVSY